MRILVAGSRQSLLGARVVEDGPGREVEPETAHRKARRSLAATPAVGDDSGRKVEPVTGGVE